MKANKIESGHYQIKKDGRMYDIEKNADGYENASSWNVYVTDSENDHEWSNDFKTKKECLEYIAQK